MSSAFPTSQVRLTNNSLDSSDGLGRQRAQSGRRTRPPAAILCQFPPAAARPRLAPRPRPGPPSPLETGPWVLPVFHPRPLPSGPAKTLPAVPSPLLTPPRTCRETMRRFFPPLNTRARRASGRQEVSFSPPTGPRPAPHVSPRLLPDPGHNGPAPRFACTPRIPAGPGIFHAGRACLGGSPQPTTLTKRRQYSALMTRLRTTSTLPSVFGPCPRNPAR